jgi:hypothetical protein
MKTFSIIERKRTREILLSNGFKKDPKENSRYSKKVYHCKLNVDVSSTSVRMLVNSVMVFSKNYIEEKFNLQDELDKVIEWIKKDDN